MSQIFTDVLEESLRIQGRERVRVQGMVDAIFGRATGRALLPQGRECVMVKESLLRYA